MTEQQVRPGDRIPVNAEANHRIWVVWEDWEEGEPVGHFTTPELAEEFAQKLTALHQQRHRVEEEPVWDRVPEQVTFHARQGQILRDGRVCDRAPATSSGRFWDTAPPQETHVHVNWNGTDLVTVWHRDPAEAQRIYDEQIVALVAARTKESA